MQYLLLTGLLFVSALYSPVAESNQVIVLTEDTFDSQVLEGNENTKWMLKFYAPWCGKQQPALLTQKYLFNIL